jgi:hypothetical protein
MSDLYFSRSIIRGLGAVYCLRIPQEAPNGSGPRRLLGSYVDETGGGFLSGKSVPGVNHAWEPEYFLSLLPTLTGTAGKSYVQEASLAGFKQTVKIEKSAGANLNGSFPGAPLSAGIQVDYKRLKTADIEFGPGSLKRYIPRGFIKAAYEELAEDSDKYATVVFDKDNMLVDQIILTSNLKVTVESQADFGASFEAKAEAVNKLGGGIKYSRKSERHYEVSVSDGKEYLFAIGAIEANKFAE